MRYEFEKAQADGYNYNFWKLFIFSFCISAIAYGVFIRMHFSLDSYSVYFEENADIHIKNARYVNYIIGTLLLKWGMNPVVYQCLFSGVLIISIAWCIARLTFFMNSIINCENSRGRLFYINIIISLGFINVFLVEWFLYPEITLYYSLSVVFSVEAALILLKGQTLKNYIVSFVLLEFSLFSYQAAMPIFMIIYLSYLLLENDFFLKKKEITSAIGGILVGFLGSLSVIILQKAIDIGESRTASLNLKHIFFNLKQLFVFQKNLWTNQLGFLPCFLVLLLIILALFFLLITLKKKRKFYTILTLIIGYSIIFAPHIVSQKLWLPERTIVAYWCFISVIGLMLLQIAVRYNIVHLIGIGFIVILFVNISSIWGISRNHFQSNQKDYQYALEIQKVIEDYERDYNIVVTQIATCRDQAFEFSYPEIEYVYCDTNTKCFSVDWGDVTAINYYNSEHYEKIAMDEEIYKKHFEGKDWKMFNSSEQMIFVEEKLYLCFY